MKESQDRTDNLLTEHEKAALAAFTSRAPGAKWDLRDEEAWSRYLEEQGVTEYARWLWDRFAASPHNFFPDGSPGREEWNRMLAFRNWVIRVLGIDVELKPAGRAVLRDPAVAYTVEILWLRDAEKTYRPVRLTVIADAFLTEGTAPDVSAYYTAFLLRVQRSPVGAFGRAPRRRPAAGKPLDVDFYRQLLAAYERLVTAGEKYPAKELARRMNEERTTVRSWLARARKLEEGK